MSTSIKTALDLVKQTKLDIDLQADALKDAEDLAWDVHDKDNWDALKENLQKVIKILESL